jgi:Holliday junction resolvase RusA-like endonuclease
VIEFFLVCVPPTTSHHAKRIVRVRKWMKLADKPELVAAKEMIDGLLVPYRPRLPLAGPLTLTLEFTWPWRAGESLKTRARRLIPRDVNPDCSNLAKTTEDRLAALRFMHNDAQVVELVVRKFFGDHPGIGIRFEPCLDPVQTVLPPLAHPSAPREAGLLV